MFTVTCNILYLLISHFRCTSDIKPCTKWPTKTSPTLLDWIRNTDGETPHISLISPSSTDHGMVFRTSKQ